MNNKLKIFKRKIRFESSVYFSTKKEIKVEKLWPEIIFSGIQPTGTPHIGNYFGAIKNLVNLQNQNRSVICSIVDLHSMTIPYNNAKLSENILLMTASLLGCGVNPDKSILFLQSTVPQHTQLYWVLGCLTSLSRLAQLPQYKEKSETTREIPIGLYSYPLLQAADILLYKATDVPVGEDQLQHLQFSSYLARKFNTKYGEMFPLPRPLLNNNVTCRIRNLQDPSKKMSKSHDNIKSRIEITDSSDVIIKKLKKAVTDSISKISYQPEARPGVSNLVAIHSALTGQSVTDLCDEVSSLDTGRYKLLVAEILIETLMPIQKEIRKLMKDKLYLISALKNGKIKASEIAADTWPVVCERVGTYYF